VRHARHQAGQYTTLLGATGKREFPDALGVLIGAVPVHRIHELDSYQPGRARQFVKRPHPHQGIKAAMIGHLRNPTQSVSHPNEVCAVCAPPRAPCAGDTGRRRSARVPRWGCAAVHKSALDDRGCRARREPAPGPRPRLGPPARGGCAGTDASKPSKARALTDVEGAAVVADLGRSPRRSAPSSVHLTPAGSDLELPGWDGTLDDGTGPVHRRRNHPPLSADH
jgi:hypothetical protein